MNEDPLAPAKGIINALLITATLVFFALSVIKGWPWPAFMLGSMVWLLVQLDDD